MASLVGLALILVPAVLYSTATPFPGMAALPPCLGAALIVAAGETGPSLVGRMLSWRPVVFVGLISYSLYLWHWPVLVFQRTSSILVSGPADSLRAKAAIAATSLVLAVLSWRFVETPFRKGRLRPARRTLFWMSGSAIAIVAAVAGWMIGTKGLSYRFSGEALAVTGYADFDPSDAYRQRVCFLEAEDSYSSFRPDICLKQVPSHPQYLILGDSHGAAIYPGLRAIYPDINFSEAVVAGCFPWITQRAGERDSCSSMSQYIFGDYLPSHPVDLVILAGRWQDKNIPELKRTLQWLQAHGLKAVVIGPGIEYDLALPRLLAFAIRDRRPLLVELHQTIAPQLLDARLGTIVRQQRGVGYISIYEDLCKPAGGQPTPGSSEDKLDCPSRVKTGIPLLFDSNHLTPQGSALFAEAMKSRAQLP